MNALRLILILGSVLPVLNARAHKEEVSLPLQAPSADSAYALGDYSVTRTKPDYHGARFHGRDLYDYEVLIRFCWGKKSPKWAETKIDEIWPVDDFTSPENALIVAWWHPDKQWVAVEHIEPVKAEAGFASITLSIPIDALAGRPYVFLFHEGKPIPPRIDQEAFARTMIASLQAGQAPPPGAALADALEERDPLGLSWLHYAAAWGCDDWIEAWVETGRTNEFKERETDTHPAILAAQHGHASTIEALARAGLDLQTRDLFSFDALQFAVIGGHAPVVETLIHHGYSANGQSRTEGEYRPLNLALTLRQDEVVKVLMDNGGALLDFNRRALEGETFRAALDGHPARLRFFLEKQADPNTRVGDLCLLDLAVRASSPEAVATLLEMGADPNGNGAKPGSPLRFAVIFNDLEIVRLLLAHGASPNPDDGSPLGLAEIATVMNRGDVVAEIFKAGGTCRVPAELAESLLVHAVSNDIVEMAALTFDQCVQPDFRFYNKYPFDWVADYYGSKASADWWESSPHFHSGEPPVFTKVADLDAPLKLVAGAMPSYDADLGRRYGDFKCRVQVVIDETGSLRFPRFLSEVPGPLRLRIHEALSTWRFNPLTRQGEPASVQAVLPIHLAPPEEPQTYDPTQLSVQPKPIAQPAPRFPKKMQMRRKSGDAVMVFVIDANGLTRDILTERTDHPLLAIEAAKAIAFWNFEPAKKDGKPVPCRVRIQIPFNIN